MAKDSDHLICYHRANVLSTSLTGSNSNAKGASSVEQGRKKETAPPHWGTETEWTRVHSERAWDRPKSGLLLSRASKRLTGGLSFLTRWEQFVKGEKYQQKTTIKSTSFKLHLPLPQNKKSVIMPMRSWGNYSTAERQEALNLREDRPQQQWF